MKLNHIAGQTWYLDGKDADIPLYLFGEGRAVLLDGGCPGGDDREALALLEAQGLTVTAMVCTHAHPDHMGLCRTLQERGAVVAMPAFEAACVDTAEHLKAWYPLFSIGQIRHYFASILFRADLPFDPAAGTLELSGAAFTVLHAPGHTPDQVCLRTPDGVWYLADALISRRDCERAKLPYLFSVADGIQTAQKLRSLPRQPALLAHGGLEADPAGLAQANVEAFRRCARRVLDLVDRPMSAEALLQAAVTAFSLRSGGNTYGLRLIDRNLTAFREYLLDRGLLRQEAIQGRMVYCRTEQEADHAAI